MNDLGSVVKIAINEINRKNLELGKQFVSHSSYCAKSRKERREIETYAEQINQLKAQKGDLEQAKLICERVGVTLEQVRKSLTKILAFANDYDFSLNDGCSYQTGNPNNPTCASGMDVNIDLNKILEWEKELESMFKDLVNYINSQYLGNFTICHKNTENLGCCVYYKCRFRFMQHFGMCYNPTTNDFYVSNPDLELEELYDTIFGTCKHHGKNGLLNISRDPKFISVLKCGQDDCCHPKPRHCRDEDDCCVNSVVLAKDPTQVIHQLVAKLDEIMEYQDQNDNEATSIGYVSDTCEQNIIFYSNLLRHETDVDENELKAKLQVGERMLCDLQNFEKHVYTSNNFFDIDFIVNNPFNW